ncbi:MAG: pantoate--beta-alanine ligase [Acidobacteria bacterium]|jgi:pantoate--beta-alanine ligase|nr:pantoate--beta-alanine ligase [Acidobacteriota bacterium]
MRTCPTIASLGRALSAGAGRKVGFVPTMGFLHEGHLSLVRRCRSENDVTVVSIYVNPSQFGPAEDLGRYPRDLRRDSALLRREGVDVLFTPGDGEMYPGPYRTWVDVRGLDDKLCGRSRPGHFRGVATIVLKLFNLVRPQRAYFGQKDAQQAIILRQMARDLHLGVQLRVLPIVRAADGLALSSRNVCLSTADRRAALALPRSLQRAAAMIRAGATASSDVRAAMVGEIAREPLLEVDYIAIVRLRDLEETDVIAAGDTLIAVALRAGKTRLIDNLLLGELSC